MSNEIPSPRRVAEVLIDCMLEDRLTMDMPPWPSTYSCEDCPFGKLNACNEFHEVANDPSEAYYDCSLLDQAKIWGEQPKCKLGDWARYAWPRHELQQPLTKPKAVPLKRVDHAHVPNLFDCNGMSKVMGAAVVTFWRAQQYMATVQNNLNGVHHVFANADSVSVEGQQAADVILYGEKD